jgi:hypothetical protein
MSDVVRGVSLLYAHDREMLRANFQAFRMLRVLEGNLMTGSTADLCTRPHNCKLTPSPLLRISAYTNRTHSSVRKFICEASAR